MTGLSFARRPASREGGAVDPREAAFEALEAVQRECSMYVADHCEPEGSAGPDDSLWQQALDHALGSKDWWYAHYRQAAAGDEGTTPLCTEVVRRTLSAYAAVSFTAVDEMQRQQVEWRLFGEVTRPKAPSPAWSALAAIGQEVRNAVRDGRCPDDTEAFNARSVVSFYVESTRGQAPVAGPPGETQLSRRDFQVFSVPRRLVDRAVACTPTDSAGALPDVTDVADVADDRVAARFIVSRRLRIRRNPRLRGA